MYPNYNSIIHSNQDVETSKCPFMYEWIKNMGHIYVYMYFYMAHLYVDVIYKNFGSLCSTPETNII